MNKKSIDMTSEDELFCEVELSWNLAKLYADLDRIKQKQSNQQSLMSLEKACLRGLLCGCTPEQIASQFDLQVYELILSITGKLYLYLQTMLGKSREESKNYQDLPKWLEAAGYKQKPRSFCLSSRQDWGKAPNVCTFYGRSQEQNTLKQWILADKSRLLAIVGSVGIGKTTLLSKIARDLQEEFDFVIWRNLDEKSSFDHFLAELISFFQQKPIKKKYIAVDLNLAELIKHLKSSRCLIILDDWQLVSKNEQKYQNYHQLLKSVIEVPHQSCLAIACSEQFSDMELLTNNSIPCLQLEGIGTAAREIFQAQNLSDRHLWDKLIKTYRGNPQELQSIATTIKNVFAGSVIEFLEQETCLAITLDNHSREQIAGQFHQLSELEGQLIQILANAKTAISREHLHQTLPAYRQGCSRPQVSSPEITKALERLLKRALAKITVSQGKLLFVPEAGVKEYLTHLNTQQSAPIAPSTKQAIAVEDLVEGLIKGGKSSVISNPQSKHSEIIAPQTYSLPVVQEDDFLPPIGFWGKLGGLFIVSAVGITLLVCAVTPYKNTVKAQAKIRPTGEVKLVEAEIEGRVVDIRVKGNQKVKQGDIIATLDNSRLQTKKSQLETTVEKIDSQLQQIQAQLAAQDRQIFAETKRIERSVKSAIAELRQSSREFEDKKITSIAQVKEAEANWRLSEQELQQAQTELRSAQAQLASSESELKAAESKSRRYQAIAATGALSQDQLEEVRLAAEQQRQQVESQKATVEKQIQGILRQQEAVSAALAKLQNAKAALDPSDAQVAIASEKIAQEKASGEATLASLRREKEALLQQEIEMQQQRNRDFKDLEQTEKDLRQTEIIATADGIIFQMNLRNAGQTVSPGKEIARIAPNKNSLAIEALVPADEISKVKLGQMAQMRVSACPYPDYGVLKGQVSQIAPDAIVPQRHDAAPQTPLQSSQSSESHKNESVYQVQIKPETTVLGQKNHQCSLQVGMEGRSDIISKQETVLKFMLRKARLITGF
jgi:multidrug efflux pump subunit AcrA (membrane-fusion protein)